MVPKACRPYRAKTKGQVERMTRGVNRSFPAWLSGQIVLRRRLRTMGRVVGEAWAEERAFLRPIPDRNAGLGDRVMVPLPAPVVDLQLRRLGERVEVRDLEYEEVVTVAEATSYQRLREHLAHVGMTAAAEHLSVELDRSLKRTM